MGMVFLAHDRALQRRIAIKVLGSRGDDEASHARLLREARSASALNHPNICTVYEVGEGSGLAFIAMEYVDGRSLRDLVDGGSLPVEDAVRYAIEAADALAHAHDRGVVHRDLKAANAIVSASGRLKIVDFGLARRTDALMSDATTQASIVGVGAAVGTPYAMAPEQVRGLAADARTDLWALGVLLYEMLLGTRPFNGATVAELLSSILRDPPAPLPPSTSHPLREILHKCLAKDPAQRYQSRLTPGSCSKPSPPGSAVVTRHQTHMSHPGRPYHHPFCSAWPSARPALSDASASSRRWSRCGRERPTASAN
jgi:serine/threonine protein kinase